MKMLKIIKIPTEKNLRYFILIFLIYFSFKFITAVIANYFDPTLTSSSLKNESLLAKFFIIVIIAPILETIIYQFAIIEIGFKLKIPPIFIIIISSLVFGFSHWYNPVYVLVTTVIGFILAYYYTALRNQNYTNRVVLVILLHALSNLIAFLNNHIFHFI